MIYGTRYRAKMEWERERNRENVVYLLSGHEND